MEEDNLVRPSADYLAREAVPSHILPLDPSRRQLLILDLNGTLVSRTKNRGARFYLRPHSESFFDYIFANFTVMVWSSATETSVNRMCKIFDPQKHPLSLVWNREHFNLSKADFYSNRETLKDLDYIWRQMPEFDATNTIIVDDTAVKVARQPHNLIQVSTFDHHQVLLRQKRDQDLCKVANYLRILKLQSNVSNFICNNPFDLRMDWGIFPNDTLDYMTVLYTKKGKEQVIAPPPRQPRQQRPTVVQALPQLGSSISSPPPCYVVLPPQPRRPAARAPPSNAQVNEEPPIVEAIIVPSPPRPSVKGKGKRRASISDHAQVKEEPVTEPITLPPRRASISDHADYIPLEPLTEEERHYIRLFGPARPISHRKIRKPKPKRKDKDIRQMMIQLADPQVKIEQVTEQQQQQQARERAYQPTEKFANVRVADQQRERARAYPSTKRFAMLRATVRSPPPCSSSSKKENAIKQVKVETVEDNGLAMNMIENENDIEKPPIRISTKIALQIIQRNIRDRKKKKTSNRQ